MSFKTRENSQDLMLAFEPDVLLTEQFYSALRRSHLGNPERRLMAAVLEDAVACLSVDPRSCSRRQTRDFLEAQAWVNGTEESDWVFSLATVCELLGIDPGYLRKGLNGWSNRHPALDMQTQPLRRKGASSRHKHLRLRAGF